MPSAERMEVMHRLHAFLLRQSNKPEVPVTQEQNEPCANSEESKTSQDQPSVHAASAPQVVAVPAAESAPAQQRRSDYAPTIRSCMRFLDSLILLAFTALAMLIAWNVIPKV